MEGKNYFDPSLTDRILSDLLYAVKRHENLTSFEIISSTDEEPKNVSPVVVAENTLGFQSWAIPHILPFAYADVTSVSKTGRTAKHLACVLALNFLHPEMNTAWNRRRELVLSGKLPLESEFRINRLALTSLPNCFEALAYRKWIISRLAVNFEPPQLYNMLYEECNFMSLLASRYHSNYHAWAYRRWCLNKYYAVPKSPKSRSVTEFTDANLVLLFATTYLKVYCEELSDSVKFIRMHISDHSGLHFRSYIFDQVFKIIYNFELDVNAETTWVDQKSAEEFHKSIVEELTQFLSRSDKTVVRGYIRACRKKLTPFDIEATFLLREIYQNRLLILRYPEHEALWSYRKYFIYKLYLTIREFNYHPIASVLANMALSAERDLLQLCRDRVVHPNSFRLLKNYSNYWTNVLKLNVEGV